MVETGFGAESHDTQAQPNSDVTNRIHQSTPVSWIGNYSSNSNVGRASVMTNNNQCPLKLDTSHPLWQTFLDSGTISPLAFFRIFLSPPTYFHSPTPWRRSTR